jgi:hydroxymethylbilane synthase
LAPFRLATRGSPLARWQAEHVISLLRAAHPGLDIELVAVTTKGDRMASVPIGEMGGQGVFVREVQASVLAGQVDAAVHSAKDLPPVPPLGLRLAAVPLRGDPRDALVGSTLDDLGPGAVVATGSQRRRAQLAWLRPDLAFIGLRGNIGTRLSKIPAGGAIVVALAALSRLRLAPFPLQILSTDLMLPQVGQGALAVECREDDGQSIEVVSSIEDPQSRQAVDAERAFLATIGGGCDLPVAAWASTLDGGWRLHLEGLVATPDGHALVRRGGDGPAGDPAALGCRVADMVLAAGGRALLAGVARE